MAKEKKNSPVHLTGELVEPLSPALWLVKWLLAIPHVVVLCFLWIAAAFVTLAAWFAVLFSGRYPPFTLQSVDYPADLQIDYPAKLKNWLVLFKWFLAIPHYAVLAAFMGGSWGNHGGPYPFSGLLWVLLLIAAVVLLFKGKYHKDIFKLVMGIHRWGFRVMAYVGLMTDEYPHFRLLE